MPYARLCLKERFCFVRELAYETQGFSFEILYQLGIRAAFFTTDHILPKGKSCGERRKISFETQNKPTFFSVLSQSL